MLSVLVKCKSWKKKREEKAKERREVVMSSGPSLVETMVMSGWSQAQYSQALHTDYEPTF